MECLLGLIGNDCGDAVGLLLHCKIYREQIHFEGDYFDSQHPQNYLQMKWPLPEIGCSGKGAKGELDCKVLIWLLFVNVIEMKEDGRELTNDVAETATDLNVQNQRLQAIWHLQQLSIYHHWQCPVELC